MAEHQDTIIFGKDGFLGSALAKRNLPPGLYYFDSPSSNILFDENLEWCVRKTITNFIDILDRVKRTGEYLVYPSSATVYNKNTHYAKTKAILEELVEIYQVPALGIRLAAGYGPGEKNKGRYASVVYQWSQQMKRGERPVIYGDGTQTRDFIYEDDVAETITDWANEHRFGLFDLGSGVNTSFNKLVATINQVLDTRIEPIYMTRPEHYVLETKVKAVPCRVSLEEGVRRILKEE